MNPINRISFQYIIIISLMIVCCLFAAIPWAHSANSSCIEGNCVNGVGTIIWSSGNKYTGEFRYGRIHGQGTYAWVDGEKYVGEFIDGKRTGQGTYTWPNGNSYVGEFIDRSFGDNQQKKQ